MLRAPDDPPAGNARDAVSDILIDLAGTALADAVRRNLHEFFRSLRRVPTVEFLEDPRHVRWHTSVPHPWFCGVLATAPPDGAAERRVDEAVAYFTSRGVAAFSWWLEPGLDVGAWETILGSRGLRRDDQTPGMALDLARLPDAPDDPPGLVVRPVEDEEMLRRWTDTFVRGYGLPPAFAAPIFDLFAGLGLGPPIRHWLGFLDGEPVVTSTVFLGAGVAGIYDVATLPPARGRGLGSALTTLPLRWARERGYRAGILQSSEQGFRVYERLGFRTQVPMTHFVWKGDAARPAAPTP